jgi:hypothetical protein
MRQFRDTSPGSAAPGGAKISISASSTLALPKTHGGGFFQK